MNKKSYTSTIVIVACLALIGFLVHMRVEPAIALALSIVPTLIAYYTNSKGEPPAATGIVFVAAALAATSALFACGCSAAQKSAEQKLLTDTATCSLRVALSDLNRSPDAALKDVATQCGEQAVTNADDRQHIIDIFSGAQRSAVQAGAKLAYVADGGTQ